MARLRRQVVGRDDELAELRTLAREPTVTLVRAESGGGKTALLSCLGAELHADGATILEVCTDGQWEGDPYAVQALLAAVRDRFEELDSGPPLLDAIHAVGRLSTPESGATPLYTDALRVAIAKLLGALAGDFPVVVLVDNLHRLPRSALWFRAAQRAGHAVVATVRASGDEAEPWPFLADVADRTVELGPLGADDLAVLIRRRLGAPADIVLRETLAANLGDLSGNPGTLTAVLGDLRRRGRLEVVHDTICLCEPDEPIPLPAEHPLLERVHQLGELGDRLVFLASRDIGFGIDQLPAFGAATGTPLARCGQAVDELVFDGVLHSDPAGTLRTRCPAVGASVAERMEGAAARRLHGAITTAMLDSGFLGSADEPFLIRHADRAGAALPAHPRLAALLGGNHRAVDGSLLTQTARLAVVWRHSPRQRHWAQPELLRLLVRTGDYSRLAQFVDEVAREAHAPDRIPPHTRDELAAAAGLTALHLGRPVSTSVTEMLTGAGDSTRTVELCERWLSGGMASPAEFDLAFSVLAGERVAGRHADHPAVEAAWSIRDLVPVLETVLGATYQVPSCGPLAAYHRLYDGFAGSRWDIALSAARQLALSGSGDPLATRFAGLLAAEICTWQGLDQQAAGWLATVPADGESKSIQGWVSSGLRYRAGDLVGALSAGWAAYRRGDPGGPELLSRLALIAVESGDRRFARRLRAEVDAMHLGEPTARSREARLLVHGLIERDLARLLAVERLARLRGHQPDLAWTCVAIGLVADDPGRWLHEAFDIADALGARSLRAKVKALMGVQGVAPPAKRRRTNEFSAVERMIIDLVRSGRTNRQIAAAVVMSEKTVEKHLTRIFMKTGYRTRHELATASLAGRLEMVGA